MLRDTQTCCAVCKFAQMRQTSLHDEDKGVMFATLDPLYITSTREGVHLTSYSARGVDR
jgi:hypothetical protein